MNPSVHDRLGSAVRALSHVILPALPPEASLAREQATLVIGHLQIIIAQLDATHAYEVEEADDLVRMAMSLANEARGGPATSGAQGELLEELEATNSVVARERTSRIQEAIDRLLVALATDGAPDVRQRAQDIVLRQGSERARKDRQWFAAMGFDVELSAAAGQSGS